MLTKAKITLLLFVLTHLWVCTIFSQNITDDSLALERISQDVRNDGVFTLLEKQACFEEGLILSDKLLQSKKHRDYFLNKKTELLGRSAFFKTKAGALDIALKHLQEAIKIKKEIGRYDETSDLYFQMAGVWHRYNKIELVKKNYDSAWAVNQRALAIRKDTSELKLMGLLLNHYGCHYANLNEMEKAERYFKRSITVADSLQLPVTLAGNLGRYAEVIHDQGRVEEAYELRKRGYEISQTLKNPILLASSSSNIALSLYYRKQYREAKEKMDFTLATFREAHLDERLLAEFPLYIAILSKLGDFREAFNNQKIYMRLKDSIFNEKNYRELADLDAQLRLENAKSLDSLALSKDFEVREVKNAKQANTQFWVAVTGLLVILAFIGFFYYRKRQKVKEQAYQNILLNNKVATKTEEINELLTETIQHIKSKERIAENLQKLATEQEGISLKSIIADLKASKADNAKLMLIKHNIEQVNFEFIKKLKTQHPDLTKTDIEICSFIRIGLSRKEIANLRNTSIEAIKSSRFRIKKKLNLDSDTSLDNYINTL